MRCADVERLWDEMREGVEPRREHLLAHLACCPPCQAAYQQLEGIAYCLTCLPPADPPTSLVPRILDHIRAVARSEAPDSITRVESPIGLLYVAFRQTGITAIVLEQGEGKEAVLKSIHRRIGRPLVPSQAPQWILDTVADWFRTHRPALDRVDISDLTPFEQAALRAAAAIPPGEVRTYGWIAKTIGKPEAARAVGRVMARNPVPLLYPCHRVVDSSGHLHNYAYGIDVKARLLESEGYRVGQRV